MRRISGAVRLVGGVALAVLAGTALAAAQDARAAIEAVNKEFMAAVIRGDAAGLAALYTTTAQALPQGGDFAKGPAAIRAVMQGALDAGIKQLVLTTLEVETHGDTAHEVGAFTAKGKDGAVLDQGKYVVVWKKEGGRWKLHRDIWNSSQPPKQ